MFLGIKTSGRQVFYSLSPGSGSDSFEIAQEIHEYVNMYRITGDDWDNWGGL